MFCPFWNTAVAVVLQAIVLQHYIKAEQMFIVARLFGRAQKMACTGI